MNISSVNSLLKLKYLLFFLMIRKLINLTANKIIIPYKISNLGV